MSRLPSNSPQPAGQGDGASPGIAHLSAWAVAEPRGRLKRSRALGFSHASEWGWVGDGAAEEFGHIYHELGKVQYEHGLMDEARASFGRAVEDTEAHGDELNLARTLQVLAKLEWKCGRLDGPRVTAPGAPDHGADGHARDLAIVYELFGVIIKRRGGLNAAEEWYRRSLVIGEELGDRSLTASNYNNLGNVADARGRLGAAADWFGGARDLYEEEEDPAGLAGALTGLAGVANRHGELDSAARLLTRALALRETRGDDGEVIVLQLWLGHID